MSTMEDKAHVRATSGLATCRLDHLRSQFGFRVVAGTEAKPERVEVEIPGYSARWRRVSADYYEREDGS